MLQDWRDLTYLLHGTATQRAAYHALEALQVSALLQALDPVLAGTIPLGIDVPGSDLDINQRLTTAPEGRVGMAARSANKCFPTAGRGALTLP